MYNFRGDETEAQESWLAQNCVATELVNQCMVGNSLTVWLNQDVNLII